MKKLFDLFLIAIFLNFAGTAEAQFLKKLGNELKKAATETLKEATKTDTPQQQTGNTQAQKTNSAAQPSQPAGPGMLTLDEQSFNVPRITPDTKLINVPEFCEISDVHNGVFSVYDTDRMLYAFYLKDGRKLFDYMWRSVDNSYTVPRFDGGACVVRSTQQRGSSYPLCILYKNGHVKELSTQYVFSTQFVDGLARMQKQNADMSTVWVYVNTEGKEVFPQLNSASYSSFITEKNPIAPLSEGLRAHYDNKLKKWGYIDEKGNIVIQPQFAQARPFSDGMAAVANEQFNPTWGFINTKGYMVLKPAYRGRVSDFNSGYCCWRDEDHGVDRFIDKTGNAVKSYPSATPFENGYAFVYKQGWDEDNYLTVVDQRFREVGQTLKFYIDKNDRTPNGILWGEAGVASIGNGGDPYVVTPDGKIPIRLWNLDYNRRGHGSIGEFTADYMALVESYDKYDNPQYGFIDPLAQYVLFFKKQSSFSPSTTIHIPEEMGLTYVSNDTTLADSVLNSIDLADIDIQWLVRNNIIRKYLFFFPPVDGSPGPNIPPADDEGDGRPRYEPGGNEEVPDNGTLPPSTIPPVLPQDIDLATLDNALKQTPRPIPPVFEIFQPDTAAIGPTTKEEPTYRVTTVADPPEGGTVSGAGSYKFGETFAIEALPNEGYTAGRVFCSSGYFNNGSSLDNITMEGEDLEFTAIFIKNDTVKAVEGSKILAGKHRFGQTGAEFVDCTVYLEQNDTMNISTPYGEKTYGFLTAIIDPNRTYTSPTDENGSISMKFFFVPMRISGMIVDGNRKYLVLDGGQLMVGGVNIQMESIMESLFYNFIMAFNGGMRATISDGHYRIEMIDEDETTGEFTLGMLERFSPEYGWLLADDSRIKNNNEEIGTGLSAIFSAARQPMSMPSWLFRGCRLKQSDRQEVLWTPPATWYESNSLFTTITQALLNAMRNLNKPTN